MLIPFYAHKPILALIIVLAVLLALALYGYLTGAWDADPNNITRAMQ